MTGHRSLVSRVGIFTFLGLSLLWSGCGEQQAANYRSLKYAKLGDIEVPEVEYEQADRPPRDARGLDQRG